MSRFFYFVVFFFHFHSASAHLHGEQEQQKVFNYKSPENIEPYTAVEHGEPYYGCGGYLRVGFIHTAQPDIDTSASALSGELGCGYQLNPFIKGHLGVFGVLGTGFNRRYDENIHADFFNRHKDGYLLLGEAVLTLSYKNFEAHLGRQNFDSPHFDGDDLRMVANLFEAYLFDYHLNEEFYFGTGVIREASGWENGGNSSNFISIGQALGGQEAPVWLSWASYEEQDRSGNAWFYFIPNHLAILYGELMYRDKFSTDIAYNLGFQYEWGQDIGAAHLGEINAHTLGAMFAVSAYDFTLTAAYNQNFGNTGAMASVGGGPFFTSLEDQTLDAVTGKDTHSLLLSMEYALSSSVDTGIAFGEFKAANKKIYHTQELNFFVNYNWQDKITTELMYALIEDKNALSNTHQIRAILTYRY